MRYDRRPQDPGLIRETHKPIRNVLRVVGPMVLVAGLTFMAIGLVSFFSAFGGSGPPKYFWCCFVGMPLMFFGTVITGAGFMSSLLRYQASEMAPVGKDTFNYLAEETKPGVHAVVSTAAAALKEGLTEDIPKPTTQESVDCPACNDPNEPDAKFCDQCGTELPRQQPTEIKCSSCQTANDFSAKFCDNCGRSLAQPS